MASNFWIGTSVEVTSGSKIVTVLASDDDISLVLEGSSFVASNYSIPFEVNRTYNDGANDIIELKEEWSGATSSSVVATVVVGPGAIAATRESVVNLISAYEEFEALVSPVVSANAIPQRTSTGQLKTADAVNDDEAVAKGQLGTAAYKDVGTSDSDVMEVGAGGLLTEGTATSLEEDTTLYPTMFGRDADGTNSYPVFGFAATIITQRYNANRQSQLGLSHNGGTPRMSFRTMISDNEWQGPYDLFGEHNSANPTDYGIGSQAVTTVTDWDDIPSDFRGIIRIGYNAANTPTGVDPLYVYHGIFMGSSYDPLLILWGADGTKTLKQYVLKVELSDDSWAGAKTFDFKAESYHSGNTGTAITYNAVTSATDDTADRLLKVGSATILSGDIAPTAPNSNLDEVVGTQVVRADNANDGPPDTIDGISAGMVFHVNRFDSASAHKASQLAFGLANSGEYPSALWHRALSGTGNESDWALVYDSGNTNFNEFGGNGTNDRIARATGRGNTTAFVELPLNSPTPPTGITVTGTFILTDATGNNTLVSGIDSTFFSIINTRPSNKFFTVWLTFSSASVTSGLPMYLQTASADAKIEVTF